MTKKIIARFKYILRFVLSDRRRKYLKHIAGEKTYSQAGQDVLAILANKRKRDGFYIEFGAQDPIKDNNTFLLESDYGWRGLSFELKEELVSYFNWSRKNLCIQGDAAEFDYKELFLKHNVPRVVDYLQVDIEPAEASLEVLKKLPFDSYQFSVITFEHDRYSSGDAVRNESRTFLESKGYVLLAKDIKHDGTEFEDWWIRLEKVKINHRLMLPLKSLSSLEAIRKILENL
jgi:hypothetical protein